ncbi:SusC/RagA family TonB-linked outer membrane protein [uncultured Microscilla sp.]|uniref:SusC/RagA family TonB-linked outer membrane protein n=1 Tax=uncultured Microscilla sp. TaxID=432653 RepID=UPI0026074762|nr:SusC/RagA family TonB-linked outer membrane protein [uncultured Microscilla sp.]
MKKQLLFTFTLVLLAVFELMAQSRTISGKVTDVNTGEGLPGVNVVVKGTTQGTATNIDGSFTLSIPQDAILVFSYVGMETQEVATNGKTNFDIKMSETSLSEVVVTASGIEKKKKALGYAVSTIDGSKIQEKSESDIGRILRGKVAGMDVTQTSGMSGAGTNIVMRGYTSISGSNQPLFVVDGVPFDSQTNTQGNFQDGQTQSSRFLDLDPNNIESVNVLKGLSATVLYGDRGRNGVILITTNTGSSRKAARKAEITLTQSVFATQIASLPDYQDNYGGGFYQNFGFFFSNWGPEFSEINTVAHPYSKFSDASLRAAFPEFQGKQYEYKAYNSVPRFFRTGVTASTSLSIRGGGPKTSYSVSYGYYDDKGFTPGNNLIRNNFSFGGRTTLANNITVGATLNYTTTNYETPPTASSQGSNPVSPSIFGNIFYTPISVDLMGLPYQNPITGGSVYYRSGNDIQNPRWTLENAFASQVVDRFFGQINATYKFNDHLNLMYRIGIDQYTEQNAGGQHKGGVVTGFQNGFYNTYSIVNRIINHDLILSYNKSLTEDIELDAILGFNARRDALDRQGVFSVNQSVFGIFRHFNFDTQTSNQFTRDENRLGAYLQANFSYKNYLFLNLVGRNDWANTLETKNQSIFYPGVSLAVDLTSAISALQESTILSYLKLRVGYGSSANFPTAYSTRNTLGLSTRAFQQNDGTLIQSNSVANRLANPDLKPERLSELEVGVETQLFKNKVGLEVSLFQKRTTNLLNQTQLLDPAGGYTVQATNAGEIKVEGIELEANIKVLSIGGFRWDVSGVLTAMKNTVVSLAPGQDQVIIAGFTNRGNLARPGQPFGALFGTKVQRTNGQYTVASDGTYVIDPTAGVIGNPQPDFTSSLTNTLSWNGITLSFEWQYQGGGDILSLTAATLLARGMTEDTNFDRRQTFILPGVLASDAAKQNNIQIAATDMYFNVLGLGADEFKVFDATHLRLNEVSLSYTLPKALIEKTPFGMVQFTLSGYNLWYNAFNFPKGTNVDPNSLGTGVGNGRGIEFLASPSAKRFGGSLKLTF